MPASYPRIPYGWADFRAIRLENRLYVDKTRFVSSLEEERYAFMIRPRRMGKSCWVSLLENYYDRRGADEFEAVLGGTHLGRQPTENRHRYVVLRFDFSTIREDLPGYTLTRGWSGTCGNHSYAIPSGERIDDLRIYVTNFDDFYDDDRSGVIGWATLEILRDTSSSLPVVGCMAFKSGLFSLKLRGISLHEIGHVLGIGTTPSDLGFLQNLNGDTHFNGPRAIAAFNDAGGWDYTGARVPMEKDGAHWRQSILRDELMEPTGGDHILSAITIQSLADLGYVVDVTQADPYTLPGAAAKARAKIAAPSTHAEPELSCGVGQQREPIYVVDQQGNVIRTLQR